MSQRQLLTRIVETLDRIHVPYMLTGSLVSSLQGEPRATHDVDLVVDIAPTDVQALVAALRVPDVYLDHDAVEEAVSRHSMFNLIDLGSGDKADFWLLTGDEYDRTRFARRIHVSALGVELSVSAPEDTILMKLRWSSQAGGSERQVADARHVYELQASSLDEGYLDEWAQKLGVADILAAIRQDVKAE